MKQLTIYCSRDLEDRVIAVLDHAGAEGYLRLAGATANRFSPAGQVPRVSSWEATLFLVPGTDEARARRIVQQLEEHADSYEIRPCLRIILSEVEGG